MRTVLSLLGLKSMGENIFKGDRVLANVSGIYIFNVE